jgi:16S rRNA C967 or C1407 C5-methylase (RsmB/RsmF family)/NOL1/NOP2/fmu family ribosome biogenesis protein
LSQQLPSALLASLQTVKGFDEAAFVQVHRSGEQITSIRKNPAKQAQVANLAAAIPWSSAGYYLTARPSFTLDPLFHAGTYYVQEASSMFLEEAVKQTLDLNTPLKVLDLCAAPGGKSTLIQSLLSKESLLVSNEVIKTRVNVLAENMTKWGGENVVVTNNDPKDFQRLANYFDAIIIDAPCSGSGLFRRDPLAIEEWSENNVALCSQRQQRILADVLPALKNDGVIIYSTCSYSQQEDEEICDWMIDELKLENIHLVVNKYPGIITTTSSKNNAHGYRFYPDKIKGEGFFIAAFKKVNSEDNSTIKSSGKNKIEKPSPKEMEVIKKWVIDVDKKYFIKINNEVIAMPSFIEMQLPILQSALYIKKAGVKVGTVMRDELVPHHELALSNIVQPSVLNIAIDLPTALNYLRREDIKIATNSKGWVLFTYQAVALGWAKILPNRVNNYYPAAWRILNK